ncbi:guanine nucleotide-binding protein subunit beta-2-like 1 protein [Nematocida displodere]|uniref:Guanine nucleotide-binding protein subunit beta-2-like 1 protein n=1 Tax=Nematocida displodere TaxID=1805483 RepID=A0A177EHB4_9MICR|nr:guanine nucleotide-binding protein subunit beta-2-like 1 protein [Nematocida displodere]
MTSLATSKLQLQFNGHTSKVTDIKICNINDTPILYTASRDKTVKGWEFVKDQTGETVAKACRRYTGHGGFVNAFEVSRDGEYLVSVGEDKMIRRWSKLTSGEGEIKNTSGKKVNCVLVNKKGRDYIITGEKGGAISIWNSQLELKKTLQRTDNKTAGVTAIKAVPNKDETFLCAYEDGSVVAWNVDTEKMENIMKGHDTIINAMTVSPDGSLCATSGRDKIVLLWDLKGQNNKCQISIDEPVHCLEFALSAYWLAAGTDNGIVVWDILEKDIIVEIPNAEENKGACTSICWADSFTLIAGYADGSIRKYAFNVE